MKNNKKMRRLAHARVARSGRRLSWEVARPWFTGIIGLLAIIFLILATPWFFKQVVFVTNKTFVLRHFDIQGGETLTPTLLEELLGRGDQPLKTGTPLFAVNIARKQREFLQSAPNVHHIYITRILPDTLKVRIEERRPLVRVQTIGGLVADKEGVIFVRYRGISELPLLTGLEGVETSLDQSLSGMAQAAVNLISFIELHAIRLPVTAIDVSHTDHLRLILIDQKEIMLAWPRMLSEDGGDKESLRRTLAELTRALRTDAGHNRRLWNATVPGRITAE